MKKLLPVLLLLSLISSAKAQIITDSPYVEKGNTSSCFSDKIVRIALDDNNTYVYFEDIVSQNCRDCWVSLSSNTRISAANGSYSLRISSWGIIDDDGDPSPLNLDERYSTKSGERYLLYMIFPRMKAGVEKINIVERTSSGEGWAWKGIHINNPAGSTGIGKNSGSSDDNFSADGSGTCFALNSNGLLATCHHVVKDARRIRIRGVGGDFSKTYSARVVISDKSNDLAIVKIDDPLFSATESLPYSISSKTVDVGEEVFALGYPLRALMGDELKLTNGIISSRTGFQGDATEYQLSVSVYPGNSGGPLFDKQGNIVGVVSATLGVLENATYAVKTPYLHTLAQSADNTQISGSNRVSTLSLADKVKQLRKFVYIIETEE